MRTRREMKKNARHVLRRHYWIFLIVCLIAAFIGTEFSGSLDFIKQQNHDTMQEVIIDENGNRISTGATTGVYESTALDAVLLAISGDIDTGKEISEEITSEEIEKTKSGEGSAIMGRSRGMLTKLVNGIDSGSIIVNAVGAIKNMGVSQNAILALFIGIALLLSVTVWFFLINMFRAVSRRIFLEARVYEKIPVQRLIFFLHVKKWTKVSVTMFMTYLLYTLWSLTIIGALIKRYSYYMVPYIVAENPDIKWREAITLSRKMMDGHKMTCFIYEISFAPWILLGLLTMGLSNLVYTNQYRCATFSEFYTDLRGMAKEKSIEGSELMNDTYLFEKASAAVLSEAYSDVLTLKTTIKKAPEMPGFRGFIVRTFGVTLLPHKEDSPADINEKLLSLESAVEGKEYPRRLSTIPEIKRNKHAGNIQYLRNYSVPSLILLFFIFSFIGWAWEVSLHLISDGVFVNRGVLHGPWLPIYGSGGVLVLVALNKFRSRPLIEFCTTVILCGLVEYFTSYFLEVFHDGQKWWDYSGYFLNLNGRICAEGLLVFGLGGMAIVYFLAPLLDNYIRKINCRIIIPLSLILVAIFAADQMYSSNHPNEGKGITDYKGASVENHITGAYADDFEHNQYKFMLRI